MRALTVIPGRKDSAQLEELDAPVGDDSGIVVRTIAVGVCGTDVEITAGAYGWSPPGESRLVLGHECVARVETAAEGFSAGDWVVPIVRRPDPVPCASCRVGEWDMCRNGRYTEHGIKELHGFCAERLRIDPQFLIRVAPSLGPLAVLLEPTSVVAKAWEQIERIGRRTQWSPRRVAITGAGPIGLLAALLGAQRGFEVHVVDREQSGPKPELVRSLGAEYSTQPVDAFLERIAADIVLECTGVAAVIIQALRFNAPGGVTCLVGVSAAGKKTAVDIGALNRSIVLENDVIFGSVNANRRHYEQAAQALAKAPAKWLDSLLTRRVPLDDWHSALERQDGDVKTLIDLAA